MQLQSVHSVGLLGAALWVNCSSPAVFKVRPPGSSGVPKELWFKETVKATRHEHWLLNVAHLAPLSGACMRAATTLEMLAA